MKIDISGYKNNMKVQVLYFFFFNSNDLVINLIQENGIKKILNNRTARAVIIITGTY